MSELEFFPLLPSLNLPSFMSSLELLLRGRWDVWPIEVQRDCIPRWSEETLLLAPLGDFDFLLKCSLLLKLEAVIPRSSVGVLYGSCC